MNVFLTHIFRKLYLCESAGHRRDENQKREEESMRAAKEEILALGDVGKEYCSEEKTRDDINESTRLRVKECFSDSSEKAIPKAEDIW